MDEAKILSNDYSKLVVKQVVDGEERTLLEITDDSETPISSSNDITVNLTPNP